MSQELKYGNTGLNEGSPLYECVKYKVALLNIYTDDSNISDLLLFSDVN